MYDIISSWKVEQNQAVKAATQGKASPAKNQTQGKEPIYGQRKPAGASDNRFIFQKRLFKSTREIPGGAGAGRAGGAPSQARRDLVGRGRVHLPAH